MAFPASIFAGSTANSTISPAGSLVTQQASAVEPAHYAATSVNPASESAQVSAAVSEAVANLNLVPIRPTNLAQQLLEFDSAVSCVGSNVVCFSGVLENVDSVIQDVRKDRRLHSARFTYIASGFLLVVIPMPHPRHEVAHRGIVLQLQRLAVLMGLKANLPDVGGITVKLGNSGNFSEPDSCFDPNRTAEPTVVIEVANTQTNSCLKVKSALWCTLPSMKAVILVKLDPSTSTITVTKVVPELQDTRNGKSPYAKTIARVVIQPTRNMSQDTLSRRYQLDPGSDQAITLACSDLTNEVAPTSGQQEFVLDSDFFQELAETVWCY